MSTEGVRGGREGCRGVTAALDHGQRPLKSRCSWASREARTVTREGRWAASPGVREAQWRTW